MYIEQLYTGCLAEAAYYIESNGEAAIVDPLRETKPYLGLAEKRNAKIKYVFETHFHADFVSGHIDLAAKSDATIVYGPTAKPGYSAYVAEDGEEFSVGNAKIKVLHTPGHTMESSTFLLIDEEGKDHAVFTGDTLFIGDVGRPDLAVKSDLTKEQLAGYLYDSLHRKIMVLDDDVVVYPGHGAGSQCGKNMSKETVSTIGQQRKLNYALQDMSKEQFVDVVTDGLNAPPAYFPENAKINKQGYENIDDVMQRNLNPLNVEDFEKAVEKGAVILDTRDPDDFEKGSVPGSINIGLGGQFAVWVGTLINIRQNLVLVTAPGKEEESVLRLARVGFEQVKGYLKGGVEAWKEAGKEWQKIKSVDPEISLQMINNGAEVLDVRRNTETETEHVEGAINIPLMELENKLGELDKNKEYVVHCAGGYRSMIASSIMKSNGFKDFANVYGGFDKMKNVEGMSLVAGKCPNQLRQEKLESLKA
ncbi:MAG TPA: MBL fold metallo-hydrolase [Cytophagales bacterium]|jgi:hydroxyacylglutathione hydrolase|nr:MBL fold metallo-hydrolase [Cytophagales bacterium]